MVNKIRFNGTEYNSLDEMPPAVRETYDKALELARQGKPGSHINIKLTTKVRFAYNGKVYENPEEMPPDVREKYNKAMVQIDKNHNGVPDLLEGHLPAPVADSSPSDADPFASTDRSTLQPLAPMQSVSAPENSNTRALLVGAGILILVLLVAVVALLATMLQH